MGYKRRVATTAKLEIPPATQREAELLYHFDIVKNDGRKEKTSRPLKDDFYHFHLLNLTEYEIFIFGPMAYRVGPRKGAKCRRPL